MVTLVFWLPLGLSVVGTAYYLLLTEENWKWKALMLSLTVSALVLQFGLRSHFLVPLVLQVAVCVWTIIYWKLDQ